jgi:hypothetical protein
LIALALSDDPKLVNIHLVSQPTADVDVRGINESRAVQLASGDVQWRTGNSCEESAVLQTYFLIRHNDLRTSFPTLVNLSKQVTDSYHEIPGVV